MISAIAREEQAEVFRVARAAENKTPPPPKVIWILPADLLPKVSPREGPADQTRSRLLEERLIRTDPRRRRRADQFTYVPEPKPAAPKPVPSRSAVMISQNQPAERPVPPPAPPLLAPAPPAPPPKQFVAPPLRAQQTAEPQLIEVPPQVAIRPSPDRVNLPIPGGEITVNKPAPKKFVPPPSRVANAGGDKPALWIPSEAPPGVANSSQAPSGEAVAAIISRNLLEADKVVKPETSRPARIEEGGIGRAKGPDMGSGLIVPGVTLRDNRAPVAVVEQAAPRSPQTAAPPAAARTPRLNTPTISVPQWPHSRRVPAEVETVFSGRAVYSTVVAEADWVLWFGEAQPGPPGTRSIMRPPVLESSPESTALLLSMSTGKRWILAKLDKTGVLLAIKPLAGSASVRVEEMGKLVFNPAIRNGQPVEVDLLIEGGR